MISRVDRDDSRKTALQENIKDTSLTASARASLPRIKPRENPNNPLAANPVFRAESQPPAIYRKNFDFAEPALKVKAAVAKDLESETDFYRLNSGERWPLASLTKLMTAVIAREEVGINKITAISKSAVASEGPAGNLEVDEQYSVEDLIKTMILVSSNDAAEAIAEFYGTEKFVDAMQIKSSLLEMSQTTFVDPTGISFLNQSAIEDLEKLVSYIYSKHPEIFEISRQPKTVISEKTKAIKKELLNINNFVFNGHPDFLGGKTGFTDQAGGNLISIFNHQGHKILIIVLGTDDRFGETEKLYNWIKEAYGF